MRNHICAAARIAALAFCVGIIPLSHAAARDGDAQRGYLLAKKYCSRCHAIGRTGASPFAKAPPFRDLHRRYPVEQLAEALAEGIVTGAPNMPEFRFEPDQIADLIAYLKSLER